MDHEIFYPGDGREIAYCKTEGSTPGVFWLGGFMSDMSGIKATFLESQSKKRGQAFMRFDYSGHGASAGDFEANNIGTWLQDALDVFDNLTTGPQIVVGSSMGGWIGMLLTLARPDRVAGLVGLAAAPDFTEDVYQQLSEEEKRQVEEEGVLYIPSDYGSPYPLSRHLFEDGRRHLLLHKKVPITCPVRLIHGKKDPDVPWQKSEKTLSMIESDDKKVIWVDDGDHRLSRDHDLQLIDRVITGISVTV
jgi:pimeloyl-ACP methyl ester carboxylesterase